MPLIEENLINTIRNKANIVDVIKNYIPLDQKGKNYFGVCPFHEDHSPSMSVSETRQIYKCFSCGAGGNVFTFISEYEHINFYEAVMKVASMYDIAYATNNIIHKENPHQLEYNLMDYCTKYYQNNLNSGEGQLAKKYLETRGLNKEIINKCKIGLSLNTNDNLYNILLSKNYSVDLACDIGVINKSSNKYYDLFKNRIMFPLFDINGQVVGYSARKYTESDEAKYINTKETNIFKKGNLLYNYHNAKIACKKEKYVLVVEGQMDAIRIMANDNMSVVALMGSSLTASGVKLLKNLRVPVYLMLDNDTTGEESTVKIGEELIKNNIETYVIRLSGEKDPDEYILKQGIDKFNNLINSPLHYIDFKMEYLKKNKNLKSNVDLTNYINEVLSSLENEDDPIKIDVTLSHLSQNYNLDKEILKTKLNKEIKSEKIKIVKIKEKPGITKLNKYDIAEECIILFMLENPKYIKMYENSLLYLPTKELRNIANDISYYYKLNKEINIADFITFISLKEDKLKKLQSIIANNLNLQYSDEEMNTYLELIRQCIYNKELESLKAQMKTELDKNKKIEIAKRITEIKKGCVLNG